MSNSNEDLPKESVSEFRNRMVRATSWSQLFPSKEEEFADFISSIINPRLDEYRGNGTLGEYRIEFHPEGDVHIFERTMPGYRTTCQKLKVVGDVVTNYTTPSETHNQIITPDVGNIAHPFNAINTELPTDVISILKKLSEKECIRVCGINIHAILKHILGKPADSGNEQIMINERCIPQRIGHRIFPDFVLQAQSRLMQAYPEYF